MVGVYEPALLALLVLLFDHWHLAFAAVPGVGWHVLNVCEMNGLCEMVVED